MVRIDAVNAIADLIRAQISAVRHGAPPPQKQIRPRAGAKVERAAPPLLGDIIRARLASLQSTALEGEGAHQRVIAVFVECVLLDAFGPSLRNNPRFQQLVGDVTHAIVTSPGLDDLVERVCRDLSPANR